MSPKASIPFSIISSSGFCSGWLCIGVTSSPLASCSSRIAICLVICAIRASRRAFFSSGVSVFLGVLGFSFTTSLPFEVLSSFIASSLDCLGASLFLLFFFPFFTASSLLVVSLLMITSLSLVASPLFFVRPRFFLPLTSSPFTSSPFTSSLFTSIFKSAGRSTKALA